MSKMCDICGKKPVTGNQISHAHNKSKKRWLPNLQRVRTVQAGQTMHIRACTNCIKSGLIVKP